MPTLYQYLGIFFGFYSLDHEPKHIHAEYQGCVSKIEFICKNGKIHTITVLPVKGKRPLSLQMQRKAVTLVQHKCADIDQKWDDFYVKHKKIKTEIITKKL